MKAVKFLSHLCMHIGMSDAHALKCCHLHVVGGKPPK